jgi:ABC-type multidrug transport system ATPase subunit
MDDAALLTARGLEKRYGSRPVLRGVDLRVDPGERLAIVGENGCGKSTLLRLLAGFEAPDAGSVTRRQPCGYSPQEQVLHPYLTPDEHFQLHGRALGLTGAALATRTEQVLQGLGFLGDRHRLVRTLSGGTRQKLNLGIALLGDPSLLLLDEPYTGFDQRSYDRLWRWLDEARVRGQAAVVVSHLVLEGARFDRMLHLREGRLHETDD